jgi:hypothetical protein
MADITYCNNKDCQLKSCEIHRSKINKACLSGKGYVSVTDYGISCQRKVIK